MLTNHEIKLLGYLEGAPYKGPGYIFKQVPWPPKDRFGWYEEKLLFGPDGRRGLFLNYVRELERSYYEQWLEVR